MSYPVIELNQKTVTGKIANRVLRQQGQIPVILYGKEGTFQGSIPVIIAKKLVANYYFMTQVFNINLGGKTYLCISKEVQFNPVSDVPDHFDFKIVAENDKIIVKVPVAIVGQEKSIGLKRGGHVIVNSYNVKLNTKVGYIPKEVNVDISDSIIGSKYYLSDLKIENATMIYNCLVARVSGRQTKEAEATTKPASATPEVAKPAAGTK